MSLFNFLMPEVAQATHLRQIADSVSVANTQSRLQSARLVHAEQSSSRRIKELESEVGQLTIVVETLLECLGEQNALSKEDLARKIGEIDMRDRVIDGRIAKEEPDINPEVPATRRLNIQSSKQ